VKLARSVSVPCDAEVVAYSSFENEGDFAQDAWDDQVENFRHALKAAFPSVDKATGWLGREDRVIAQNMLCAFGLSEYCGLVSLWIAPRENNNLASQWAANVQRKFNQVVQESWGQRYVKAGTFSNGESIYQRAAA